MLAGAESGGNINWLIIVLGNAFVCAMEGLIVGIQVLRLEYSRNVQPFLQWQRQGIPSFLKAYKQQTDFRRGINHTNSFDL